MDPLLQKCIQKTSMNISLERYDDLVHAIYAAALAPAEWPRVLAHLSSALEARQGLLFTPRHSPAQGGFAFTHNISLATVERWAARSIHDDLIRDRAYERGLVTDGMAINGDDLVPRAEVYASRFYRELWQPAGISHGCIGVVFAGGDARQLPTAVCVYRGPQDEAFLPRHADTLRRLLVHLSRALGVMYHLRDQQLQLAATLSALDRLSSAVVLLDAGGATTFVNRRAEQLLRRADLVTVRGGAGQAQRLQLAPALQAQQPALQALIERALQGAADEDEHFSQALVLLDAEARPACVVQAAPLGAGHFDTGGRRARAIVFLYHLADAADLRPELLCELFELTPGEARAALQVLQGGSLADMAARLGVSANTLKTQLRLAYEKTRTHRQADLLKLLLSLASG